MQSVAWGSAISASVRTPADEHPTSSVFGPKRTMRTA
jgi:hypothetical protein